MDKDYVAVEFSGKNLSEVANKMALFLNSIKGVNLVNLPEVQNENKTDSDRLLQGEPTGVREEVSGDCKGACKDTKKL